MLLLIFVDGEVVVWIAVLPFASSKMLFVISTKPELRTSIPVDAFALINVSFLILTLDVAPSMVSIAPVVLPERMVFAVSSVPYNETPVFNVIFPIEYVPG